MGIYGDWESLTAAAQAEIDKLLREDVLPEVKRIVLKHTQSDIYDAYFPLRYKRRDFLKNDSFEYVENDSGRLLYTLNPPASGTKFKTQFPGSFLKMLELGDLGWFSKHLGGGKKVFFPRPAIWNAQQEIDETIKDTIHKGIKRRFT